MTKFWTWFVVVFCVLSVFNFAEIESPCSSFIPYYKFQTNWLWKRVKQSLHINHSGNYDALQLEAPPPTSRQSFSTLITRPTMHLTTSSTLPQTPLDSRLRFRIWYGYFCDWWALVVYPLWHDQTLYRIKIENLGPSTTTDFTVGECQSPCCLRGPTIHSYTK